MFLMFYYLRMLMLLCKPAAAELELSTSRWSVRQAEQRVQTKQKDRLVHKLEAIALERDADMPRACRLCSHNDTHMSLHDARLW